MLFKKQLEFVNKEILANSFSLLDIGFTTTAKGEGGTQIGYVIYNKYKQDET